MIVSLCHDRSSLLDLNEVPPKEFENYDISEAMMFCIVMLLQNQIFGGIYFRTIDVKKHGLKQCLARTGYFSHYISLLHKLPLLVEHLKRKIDSKEEKHILSLGDEALYNHIRQKYLHDARVWLQEPPLTTFDRKDADIPKVTIKSRTDYFHRYFDNPIVSNWKYQIENMMRNRAVIEAIEVSPNDKYRILDYLSTGIERGRRIKFDSKENNELRKCFINRIIKLLTDAHEMCNYFEIVKERSIPGCSCARRNDGLECCSTCCSVMSQKVVNICNGAPYQFICNSLNSNNLSMFLHY